MPRTRSPDRDAAEKMYLKGMLLKDIAAKLKVPEGTVRSWKNRGKWDAVKEKRRGKSVALEVGNVAKASAKIATPKKKKMGPPYGNKNALGNRGGGPVGNRKAWKHGAYSSLRWDFLDDEEKELLGDFPEDNASEMALIESIKLYTLRERKIMKAIARYEGQKEPVVLTGTARSENKRTFDGTAEEQEEQRALYEERINEKVENGERLPGREYMIETTTENKDHIISRLQQELTSVTRSKVQAADLLEKLRNERKKMEESDSGNEIADIWASVFGGADDG